MTDTWSILRMYKTYVTIGSFCHNYFSSGYCIVLQEFRFRQHLAVIDIHELPLFSTDLFSVPRTTWSPDIHLVLSESLPIFTGASPPFKWWWWWWRWWGLLFSLPKINTGLPRHFQRVKHLQTSSQWYGCPWVPPPMPFGALHWAAYQQQFSRAPSTTRHEKGRQSPPFSYSRMPEPQETSFEEHEERVDKEVTPGTNILALHLHYLWLMTSSNSRTSLKE